MKRRLAIAVALTCLASVVSTADAHGVSVTLGGDTLFPARTLVVSGLGSTALGSSTVHITENGQPVSGVSVESAGNSRRGDLGVMLVVDRSPSMGGAPSQAALRAVQLLAAQRAGNQELGIIAFDANPTLYLPLTSNAASISQAVQALPPIGAGTHILPALDLAVQELAAARVAAGAIILLSDGADREPVTQLTPAIVAAQARAAHIEIFTVGMRDRYYTPASMAQLAQIGGGQFIQAVSASQVERIFGRIQADLTSSWLIRYRSSQPLGRSVAVGLRIDGVPGALSLRYFSPEAPRLLPARPSHRPQPFWESSLALILVAAVCALLLGMPVLVILRRRAGPGTVQHRVSGFVSNPAEAPAAASSFSVTAAEHTRATLARSSWWPRFIENVDIAMIERTPEKLVLDSVAAGCILAALVWLVTGSPLAGLLPLLAVPFGLNAYVQRRVRRQRQRFSDQLPSHLEEVSAAIRSGRSLIEAMNAVTTGSDEPTRREFERALADENLGRPLDETLRVISARMDSEGVDQVAVVTAMHRRTGSSVSEALDRVAEGARERAELQRDLRALTAQGRLARWILTFLPPTILLIMVILSPKYVRPLFHTFGGLLALAVATVMVIAGSIVMKWIVDIEV